VNDKNEIHALKSETFVGRYRSREAAKLLCLGEVVSPLPALFEVISNFIPDH
jgi:hypothetical protein